MRLSRLAPANPLADGPVAATLRFARGGGRTFLAQQHVPYPFHITRPHALTSARPDVATLILQSASGGLYRDDRLVLDITAAPGASAIVRSQAATVTHASVGAETHLDTRLHAGPGAFLAVTTDPYILLPSAALAVRTDVWLAPEGAMLFAEGFAIHDPRASAGTFRELATRCRIYGEAEDPLVDERSAISGHDFCGADSPLGQFRAMGTVLLAGADWGMPAPERLLAGVGEDVLAGMTALPGKAGWCVRLLAPEGGRLSRGLETVCQAALAIWFGTTLLTRR